MSAYAPSRNFELIRKNAAVLAAMVPIPYTQRMAVRVLYFSRRLCNSFRYSRASSGKVLPTALSLFSISSHCFFPSSSVCLLSLRKSACGTVSINSRSFVSASVAAASFRWAAFMSALSGCPLLSLESSSLASVSESSASNLAISKARTSSQRSAKAKRRNSLSGDVRVGLAI